MTDKSLNGDYEVRAYDRDDELVQSHIVEEIGDIVIEDVFRNAVLHRLDRIEITTLKIRMTDDEGNIVSEIETDVEPQGPKKLDI